MKLTINGQERDFADIQNARELVENLGLINKPIAIELNYKILPKQKLETTKLSDGDKLEIVSFVGGG